MSKRTTTHPDRRARRVSALARRQADYVRWSTLNDSTPDGPTRDEYRRKTFLARDEVDTLKTRTGAR